MELVVTISGNSDDLRFIRDKVDGAIADLLEENYDKFEENVTHFIEYADSDE